ncbi:unnamed protein product [Prorocentrum cordatum]|uniref:Component of oligomeric Golgi complex 3 n=1 Tax=Prorocentrum cordatum TaxID=2364126 RepID=A0ABN9UX76_9DINO|nr:unnamed protein product [Polarella glacialis]
MWDCSPCIEGSRQPALCADGSRASTPEALGGSDLAPVALLSEIVRRLRRPHLHALAESTKEAAVSGAKQADKAFSSYLQHVRYNLESYIEEGDEDELSEDDSSPRTRRSSRRSTRRRTLGAATPLQERAGSQAALGAQRDVAGASPLVPRCSGR